MCDWAKQAIIYHMYPLGLLGCEPYAVSFCSHRLLKLTEWIDHLRSLHVNTLYLGPLFQSQSHGYDTIDYRQIDSRLGTSEDMIQLCQAYHDAGIRIVLDGVFHHVGRDFFAFQDLLKNKEKSLYLDWFLHVDFTKNNWFQDGFCYDTWKGCADLVKLNLENEEVIAYLFESIRLMIEQYDIDGFRLDAADCMEFSFFTRLKQFTQSLKPEFWLMGEVVFGDYTKWVNAQMLDSITNYEMYHALHHAHNTNNYFELAYALERQYGTQGVYRNLNLYQFADNHDVHRIASMLKCKKDLFNLYTLLYTIPGIPSIYYGSEFGLKGRKRRFSDSLLRPAIDLQAQKQGRLLKHLRHLGLIHSRISELQDGVYEQILVRKEQFVFARYGKRSVYVLVNQGEEAFHISIPVQATHYSDVLHNQTYHCLEYQFVTSIPARSAMILVEGVWNSNLECIESGQRFHVEVPVIPYGKYRHFKGRNYILLYIATHSEDETRYAVYRQLYGDGSVWIRPLEDFCAEIERDGKKVKRFTYIGT